MSLKVRTWKCKDLETSIAEARSVDESLFKICSSISGGRFTAGASCVFASVGVAVDSGAGSVGVVAATGLVGAFGDVGFAVVSIVVDIGSCVSIDGGRAGGFAAASNVTFLQKILNRFKPIFFTFDLLSKRCRTLVLLEVEAEQKTLFQGEPACCENLCESEYQRW